MLLFILWACTGDAAEGAADSAAALDSGGDTGVADTGDADTGEQITFVHYMSLTSGVVSLTGSESRDCAGEAHVNVYSNGDFKGFANCLVEGDEDNSPTGQVLGTATAGVVSADWSATLGELELELPWTGTFDDASLTATFTGENVAAAVSGTVVGEAY